MWDALIGEGRIFPAQREAFIELSARPTPTCRQDGPPGKSHLITLSGEQGQGFNGSRRQRVLSG